MIPIYLGTLLAMGVAALLPGVRVWGLDAFRFVTPPVLGVLAIAAMLPFVSRFVPRPRVELGDRAFFAPVAIGAAALFVVGRSHGHFLGDGYQSLSLLAAEHPYAKGTAPLFHFLLARLKDALGGQPDAAALSAYRIMAVVSGVAFLGAVWFLGGRLVETSRARRLLLLGLASGGWSLLFFGYVENYAPFVATVAAYAFAGAWSARTGRGVGLAVGLAALAAAFHVLGLLVWPSLLYLARGTRPARAMRRWSHAARLAIAAFAVVVALAALATWSARSLSARTLFVPLTPSPLVPDDYALFSARHLVDLANLALLLIPGIAVLAIALIRAPRKAWKKDPAVRFLAALSGCVLFGIFVLDPKLGMPRDWDLFAFAGVPVAAFAWLAVLARSDIDAGARKAAWLAIALGLLGLAPRVFTNAHENLAFRRFRSHLELDHGRGRAARYLAVLYFRRIGAEDVADAEVDRWDRDYPERVFNREAMAAQDRGDFELALHLSEQAIAIRPSYSDAWNNLGSCQIELGKFEEARVALENAFALNPNEPGIMLNLGTLGYRRNDFKSAETWWRRAATRDQTAAPANYYLARLAQRQGDDREYERRLGIASAMPSATPKMLDEWASWLEANGRAAEADAVRRRIAGGSPDPAASP